MNKVIGYVLLAMMMVCSVAALSITINTPTASQNINGTFNFTATLTIASVGDNVSWCTFASTADGVFANQSLGNKSIYYNVTDTSSVVTDAASTTITVTCYNQTNGVQLATATVTGITVDNADPSCDCSFDRESINLFDEIIWDCTASTDATSATLNHSCVMTKDDGTTETETGTQGIFDETDDLGEASITCTTIDEVNKRNSCSAQTIQIKGDGDQQPVPDIQKPSNTFIIVLVLIIAMVAIGVFTSIKKK